MQDHLVALGAMDVVLELIDAYTSPARDDASDVNTIASSRSIFILSLNLLMLVCERHGGVQAMTRHHITYLVLSEHFWDQEQRDLAITEALLRLLEKATLGNFEMQAHFVEAGVVQRLALFVSACVGILHHEARAGAVGVATTRQLVKLWRSIDHTLTALKVFLPRLPRESDRLPGAQGLRCLHVHAVSPRNAGPFRLLDEHQGRGIQGRPGYWLRLTEALLLRAGLRAGFPGVAAGPTRPWQARFFSGEEWGFGEEGRGVSGVESCLRFNEVQQERLGQVLLPALVSLLQVDAVDFCDDIAQISSHSEVDHRMQMCYVYRYPPPQTICTYPSSHMTWKRCYVYSGALKNVLEFL
jgi:hypothetical protein